MRMKDVDLLHAFLERSAADMQSAINLAHSFNDGISNHGEQASLDDCLELMELSRDRIMDSIVEVERRDVNWHTNGQAWLGMASNDRKLLQALPNEIKVNVVVVKDGSGNYKTLGEAVAPAPDKSETSLNVIDGSTTFNSATIDIGPPTGLAALLVDSALLMELSPRAPYMLINQTILVPKDQILETGLEGQYNPPRRIRRGNDRVSNMFLQKTDMKDRMQSRCLSASVVWR
ncbi:hypothetical protein F3Y22_tig00110556pilonHSYRG00074 [Hibiscus syriacus]|uniref:Uncharacterized protein n=1 Tax=Hibiscus syriacus TaxID=106335 RepID=A0A6A3A7W5_HIBSY|nr:hypothetical protein F3Y22_tig00110556pilonHSYRG00074 [Hibiscus syriacus]